jgi:hypothetical protein
MIMKQHLADLPQPLRYFLEYRKGWVEFRFLRHIGQLQSGSTPDPAIVRFDFARNDAQQTRLSPAISTDQPDTFAGIKLQVYLIKQGVMTKGKAGSFKSEERHGQGKLLQLDGIRGAILARPGKFGKEYAILMNADLPTQEQARQPSGRSCRKSPRGLARPTA